MSTITEEAVRQALSKVRDPATERDIVSSQQLRRVTLDGDQVALVVDLVSPGYPLKATLDAAIREALEPNGVRVKIEWGLAVPRKPARADQNRLPTVKNIIAVAAGKGGVGKSTVSTNLALALKKLGASVGILDADIYGPSVPKMLGTPQRPTDKSTSGDRIIPALYRGIPAMSVDYFVEPGRAVVWRGPMIHKLLQQFLEDVEWGDLDYLIVDLPPGTGDAQLSLGQLIPITGGVIVTTPQEVALLDVRKAVDMFKKLEIPVLGVVENMSYYKCPSCGYHDDVFDSGGGARLARDLGVDLLGQLPLDRVVSLGGERGVPIVESAPESEHAKVLFDVAARAAMAVAKISGTGPKRSSMLRTVT
jgi:ATP-binding protein involved in chromosome partitioning